MNIIPKPQELIVSEGFINKRNLAVRNSDESETSRIQRNFVREADIQNQDNVPMSESGNIFFVLSGDITNEEAYQLKITETHIEVSASGFSGLFYGSITLLQIFKQYSQKIPCCEIEDSPRFSWRGMHLDVSRHFYGIVFIKKYIDLLASLKLNVFHWHLTDDNGWRIEIKKYPLLTEIGAFRTDLEHLSWNERDDKENEGEGVYGGFYTQEQIREIVEYAEDRFITVVPEIEMPGHSREVFAAYPQYSCKGKKLTTAPGSYWPNTDIFCAGNDETFTFIEYILEEVIQLFPSEYIHIGGDEANKTNWEKCPKCQKRIQRENLKDEKELQSWFIKKAEAMLKKRGRKLIGWDEITEGGLAEDATVMCWRGDGIDAVKNAVTKGNKAVMCPNPFLYFDWKQTEAESEQGAFGVTTLETVYNYDPTPDVLTDEQKKLILGAQANVWTEWMPTEKDVEYMTIPRIYALAEIVWSQNEKDFEDFKRRLDMILKQELK